MFAHFTQETGGHNPHADEEEWRQVFKTVHQIAKDCLLTLVKSRLALGSPGCLFVCLFVTMPKMAQ